MKSIHPRRSSKKRLRGNPKHKSSNTREQGDPKTARDPQFRIVTPVTRNQASADDYLDWENPILRRSQRPMGVALAQAFYHFTKQQNGKKCEERREISSFVQGNADHWIISMDQKEQPSPEQLLKMLDLQMQTSRQARAGRSDKRNSTRILTISILLFVMMAALWVLMMILEDMRPEKPDGSKESVPSETR